MVIVLILAMTSAGLVFAGDAGKFDHSFYAYKFASQKALGPSESLTYTILLYNSSLEDMIVDVVDTIPEELTYSGTASPTAVYDAINNTLTWEDIEVPLASQVLLTFDMVAPATVSEAIDVTNTATVTTEKNSYDIEFTVDLLTEAPLEDVYFPVVNSVVIDEMDVLIDVDVVLHIDAMDYVAADTPGSLDQMLIKEWELSTDYSEGWVMIHSTGWIPFDSDYDYTLGDQPGIKFVAVWVKDEAGNISHATQEAFDFASYLKPSTELTDRISILPYGVYFDVGESITATLVKDPISDTNSSVGLIVWTPEDYNTPIIVPPGAVEGDPIVYNGVSVGGIYVFGVNYTANSTLVYDLTIDPEGGPSAWGVTPGTVSAETAEAVTLNPFSEIGFNPIAMGLQDQPNSPSASSIKFYLPILWR